MTDEPFDQQLREFILRYFESVAHLEALLLLSRQPDRTWDAAGAARRLYVPQVVASEVLAQLCADGLLAADGATYRYCPSSSEMAVLVDRLDRAYSHALIPVTNLVHGNPRRHRKFADAFRVRKDK